jgi:hypothetical protein
LNKQQEEKVLETFKWKLVYQENLDSMFLQAYDCALYVEELQNNYFSLSNKFDGLEQECIMLEKDCINKLSDQQKLIIEKENQLISEQEKKRTWRGIAIGEGIFITLVIALIAL